jgi:16S rRNA (cytosine967-C5)-methyltransferase
VIPEICEKLLSAYDFDKTERILCGMGNIPPTTIRTNTLRTSRDELLSKINGSVATDFSPHGLRTKGSVRELYGFEDGLFFVQDEASQICVEALGATAGDTLLDICSCPGSKSFGAAINMENKGRIIAFDLHENKLSLVVSSAKRLGIDIIEAKAHDGRVFIPELEEAADKVLCDVPCSGFGVLAKKPELRYKDPKESAALPKIQLDILNNACRYVKRGGTLVYSTCTIFPEENEENLKRFLASHPEFELTPFTVGALDVPEGYITFFPDKNYFLDGFFISKLTKRR